MFGALSILVSRHLIERPVRTAITILGIALGVSVTVAIRTANLDILKSFEDTVLAVAGRATLQVSGGDLGVDEGVIPVLLRHPDVMSATPVLQLAARVATGPSAGRSLTVMGLDLLEAADLKRFRIRRDGQAEPALEDLLSRNAVFVGRRLAAEWKLGMGSTLDLLVGARRYRLVVQGVIESKEGIPAAWEGLAVMDIAAAQALFGLVGRLDRIDLVTETGRPVNAIAQELQVLLPPSVTVSRPARRNEQVERMVRAFQLNLSTLSAVGLLVGLLLVYNTVSFAVVQRRREIGIFRALGMSRGGVSGLFMCEAALMGLLGGLAGSVLGVALARSLVSLLRRTVSDLYVPVVSALREAGTLAYVPSDLMVMGGAIGVAVSILGSLGPSMEASRTAPARALAPGEYEAVQAVHAGALAWVGGAGLILAGLLALPGPVEGLPVFGYASALCLLLGLSCLAPAFVRAMGWLVQVTGKPGAQGRGVGTVSRLAADQVARAPGRNAVTISALMVGLAIMVGVGIMIHSFRRTVEAWINQTIMADLVVAPTSWLHGEDGGIATGRIPAAWTEAVSSVGGVAAVDPYRQVRIEVRGQPVSLVSRDLRVHAERSRYLFMSEDPVVTLRQTIAERGVILSEVLAAAVGLKAGDELLLMTPSGPRTFRVKGVFYDYATDGGKVVMDRALYRDLWGDDSATVLAVYLAPGRKAEEVRKQVMERISELEGQTVSLAVIRNDALKAEILAIFDRTFTITYALEIIAVVIAILGIVNTLLTSVLERQRELATLRAVGASERQIRRLVLWESCYLGVLGGALGLAGGLLLSILLIEVINKQSFGWTIQFALPPLLLGQAVGLALAAALVAGYLPARWAAKQPVADGLRYE